MNIVVVEQDHHLLMEIFDAFSNYHFADHGLDLESLLGVLEKFQRLRHLSLSIPQRIDLSDIHRVETFWSHTICVIGLLITCRFFGTDLPFTLTWIKVEVHTALSKVQIDHGVGAVHIFFLSCLHLINICIKLID